MVGSIICFVDIETDGPLIGVNAMRSFAAVALDDAAAEVGSYNCNLSPFDGAQVDPKTEAWWRTQPEAWANITRDPKPSALGMAAFAAWVRTLPAPRLYAAYPLIFDGPWIDWYLRRFTDATLCDPFRPGALFSGTGIDVPTYVQTVLRLSHSLSRKDYPAEILTTSVRLHDPLSDARGHAALYFAARKQAAERG